MIEKVLVVTAVWLFAQAASDGVCRVSGPQMTCRGENSLHLLKTGRDYSKIDTLNVHQSKLDLTDDLIPNEITFSELSLLNATDNEISRIGRRGFNKTRNVQFLYLTKNKISHVQPDPLQDLKRLELLEMDDALDGSADEKKEILRTFFKSKNMFVHLSKIELNKNGLEDVHQKTFCGVQGLKRLELSNNRLTSFDFARSCFGELKALMVAGNLIEKIPTDIWDFLPSLSSLDISNNPLNCDCDTVRLLRGDDVVFINQEQTKCASPSEVEGKVIFDLPKDYCSGKPRAKASFLQFLVLFVIAVGILYLYKRYRERANYMSAAPVGYHNLQHEQAVQPEFV